MNLNLLSNLINNYKFLQEDFLGISFNLSGILAVFVNIFFSIFLIVVIYLFGNKVRSLLFEKYNGEFKHFISIGLGYIIFTTGIFILGIFSLLYPSVILIYMLFAILIGIYPMHNIRYYIRICVGIFKRICIEYKSNKWAFVAIFLFVFIAFLRLIPPETGEDAISHHTSLPALYLRMHSVMVDPKLSSYIVIPVPQLGDMMHVVTQAFDIKDSSRHIHFVFYIIFLTLIYAVSVKNKLNGYYSILLFLTAPVVIQVSSKANVDFQWLFCWILSIALITGKKLSKEELILSAIMFGGVLATKLWTIAFLPIFLIYLFFANRGKLNALRKCLVFLLISLIAPLFWYCRSYILTGTPFYPVFSPVEVNPLGSGFSSFIGFSRDIYNYEVILKFSPIALAGMFLFLLYKYNFLKKIGNYNLLLLFALLGIEILFLRRYFYPRYLMGLYALFVILISLGIKEVISKSVVNKIIIVCLYVIMFIYYFTNTLFTLPYGFGWADSNIYLTRILSRDNSSYYDFNHLFNKWITSKDLVATYGINGYYYANFHYIDAKYILDKQNMSLDLLMQNNITKLFIRGGDLSWFCNKLNLKNCDYNNARLLVNYQTSSEKYYLYSIKE